jgi:Cys-tRNA(Pro) deacylase
MPWIRARRWDDGGRHRGLVRRSLRRLQTDVIDLYQIHWPERHVPAFGIAVFRPRQGQVADLHGRAAAKPWPPGAAGKVRHIGLSNETPYGVHEFVRLAEQHGLPRVASVQNPYCLINRTLDNGLDETLHRLGVSLLAYSPLGFGLLTGKYDATGIDRPRRPRRRMAKFESMKKQRWGRPEALVAARRYNALAREHGLTPTQLALAFCYTKWRVASTIIGVTSLAQLDEDLDAWGTPCRPSCWQGHRRASAGNCATRRCDCVAQRRPCRKNLTMARKDHVSETPATALLKANRVAFTEHPYEYLEHGGAQHSAEVLGWDPFAVVKTLVMQDQDARPLLVLMHGNRKVSTKNLARQIGAKSVEPCKPEVANRHSGYLVGGTSPFGTRRPCRCSSKRASWRCRKS